MLSDMNNFQYSLANTEQSELHTDPNILDSVLMFRLFSGKLKMCGLDYKRRRRRKMQFFVISFLVNYILENLLNLSVYKGCTVQ